MLFHNRPVRAAMGSVIANGGVQLSNDESLIRAEWKLGTLHFGGCVSLYGFTGGSAGESESGVGFPFLGGGWVGGVGWFGSVSILHLAKVHVSSTELLRFGSRRRNYWFKEEMEMRTSSMWPWLARMDNEVGHTRLSCQEEVPLLNLLFILSWCNTIHWYCCVWFTASSSWKVVAALSTMGLTSWGTRMRTLQKTAQWGSPGLSSSINGAMQVKG